MEGNTTDILGVPSEIISQVVTTIFPGSDYISTLTLIFIFLLVGYITQDIFFFLHRKENIWDSLTWSRRISFSFFLGSFSLLASFTSYLLIIQLGIDPIIQDNLIMPLFMIFSGGVLYISLLCSLKKVKDRRIISRTCKYLAMLFLLIFFLYLIVLEFKNRNWYDFIVYLLIFSFLISLEYIKKIKDKVFKDISNFIKK